MNPLLVNVAELLRRPGSEKDIEVEVPVDDLVLGDHRVPSEAEVRATFHLESLTDGIVVTAEIRAPWNDSCRRCLRDLERIAEIRVRELYQVHVTADDAFPIVGEQIDLTPAVRESVLLELPAAPLCRDDCLGICPVCGADRNVAPCGCSSVQTDDRWAALDAVRPQLN